MAMSLRDMAVGEKGKIVAFQKGDKSYRKKLLAMGLTPKTDLALFVMHRWVIRWKFKCAVSHSVCEKMKLTH
ncbi:Ferrous iron transport protein A [Beggiatoa sp. PS]|nr:Ferrous iron transport protein A [Beggiatoa sp. PS]